MIIGERLNELKKEMKKDGSNFIEWLEQDTRITYSTANRYMNVAEGYRTKEHTDENKIRNHVAALGIKKAYLLLKIADIDERYRFIKDNKIRYKSYETTNDLLKEYLKINNTDTKDTGEDKDILDKTERDIIKAIKKYKENIDDSKINLNTIDYKIKEKMIELEELFLIKEKESDTEAPGEINEYE